MSTAIIPAVCGDIMDDPRIAGAFDLATLDARQMVIARAMLDEKNLADAGYGLDEFLDRCLTFDVDEAKFLAVLLDSVDMSEGYGFSFDFLAGCDGCIGTYEVSMWHAGMGVWLCSIDDAHDVDPWKYRNDGQPPLRAVLSAIEAIDRTRAHVRVAFDWIDAMLASQPHVEGERR